jgi:hypothetical protein
MTFISFSFIAFLVVVLASGTPFGSRALGPTMVAASREPCVLRLLEARLLAGSSRTGPG